MSNATHRYRWQAPEVGEDRRTDREPDADLRLGFIGLGLMGGLNLDDALRRNGIRITALCDVDELRLRNQADRLHDLRPEEPLTTFRDFRDLHRSGEVDAVIISTPDHWHALQGIDAMACGLDVYIEKPLSLTVAEGRALCRTADRTGRIGQTGSQQRSSREFRYACELVRNGYLGDLKGVEVGIPPINRTCGGVSPGIPVPETFDYNLWLGPAPDAPYHPARCHYNFRFISAYSGGQLTNWGAHMMDIVQWALGMDESGPARVEGRGTFSTDGLFDVAEDIDLTWTYPGDIPVHCATGKAICRFIGSESTLDVGRGLFQPSRDSLNDVRFTGQDVRLYRSDNHLDNFLESIRTRQPPVCPLEIGHRSAAVCHIANIALRLGRGLDWDPVTETFPRDAEANALLSRPMRPPWRLPTEE